MAQQKKGAVTTGELSAAQIKHPIKAATLLYRAPGYILRGPIYLIFIIVMVSFFYSFWATKNIIVVAPLQLQRESSTIQAVGGGMVIDLLTEENAFIKAGDPIAVVQEQIRAVSSPEQEAIIRDINDTEDRLENSKKDYEFKLSQLEKDLHNFEETRDTNKANLNAQIKQTQEQLKVAKRGKRNYISKLKTSRKRYKVKTSLYKTRDITITEYESAKQEVDDLEKAVNDSESEIQTILLTLQTKKQNREKLDSPFAKEKLVEEIRKTKENRDRDNKKLKSKIAGLKNKLENANTLVRGVTYDANSAKYRATFDGVVTDIYVKRGEIITAGQPLVTVVKASAALVGQSYVANKDIGNLKFQQPVKIKFFAYPYQEYGIQKGNLIDIATKPGGIDGQESMYVVKIALKKETISKRGGKKKNLEIGLEGVAEIKTGEKRLIELVFAPVSKFFQNPEDEE
ncbi:MAG: HlyD family efflux transporter periplasmic adaptor subunit [Alphaproteobacteria bacterium]|nr:HlyD family efflux transporter periplasmic adaptor subunit [Alphaproteobacteria bacterium]